MTTTIDQIWQAYGNNLKALLHAKLGNPADADDLLQEILLKTHQQIGTLTSADKLKPWLFRLANNTVIDFYRARGRRPPLSAEDLWYSDEDSEADQTQATLSSCILPFLDALPTDTAELLRAIDIEGRSQKAYAEELGVSYSALKSRVQRGRTQLRAVFEQCCVMELDACGRLVSYEPRGKSCNC